MDPSCQSRACTLCMFMLPVERLCVKSTARGAFEAVNSSSCLRLLASFRLTSICLGAPYGPAVAFMVRPRAVGDLATMARSLERVCLYEYVGPGCRARAVRGSRRDGDRPSRSVRDAGPCICHLRSLFVSTLAYPICASQ